MRRTLYILVSLLVLWMSWEKDLEASPVIPEESIRLRILANSDAPADQWIKRKVRDEVVDEINRWAEELKVQDLRAARALVQDRLPRLETAVERILARHGVSYGAEVQLGRAAFPTKAYGTRLYPAGEYEALVITLGEGKGKNWWCVLFPPLCFIDVTTDEVEDSAKQGAKPQGGKALSTEDGKGLSTGNGQKPQKPELHIAFFFVELWNRLFG